MNFERIKNQWDFQAFKYFKIWNDAKTFLIIVACSL